MKETQSAWAEHFALLNPDEVTFAPRTYPVDAPADIEKAGAQ